MSVEASVPPSKGGFRLPLFESIRPYRREWLSRDVVAGVTLAALAIPEVMGYTRIAGTPVVTGLYTILIPILAFAVFASSRHLVVGGEVCATVGDARDAFRQASGSVPPESVATGRSRR